MFLWRTGKIMKRKIKKIIKKNITNIAKKNTTFRKIVRSAMNCYRGRGYNKTTSGIVTDENTIIFISFNGKSYSDTPKAVYEYMLSQEKYERFDFIWVVRDLEKYSYLLENPRTSIVKNRTKEYYKALALAKYWVCNYRIYDHIVPKEDQVYIQCWHGTPLKRLGYDIENSNNAMNSSKEIKEKYRTDAEKFKYILSPSAFATEKFSSAWNLNETGQRHKVMEIGYPRNDFMFNYTQEKVKEIKDSLEIPKDKKVLLYAPTWRDNQHTTGVGYTFSNIVDFTKMQDVLKDWVILFRAHYLVANGFDFEKYAGFVYDVSRYDDINELYVISDMLMTDYSSVFFDYANLKRPMMFYMYDLDMYANRLRGFYIDLSELPGPIVQDEDEMIEKVSKVEDWFVYDTKYSAFNQKYNYLDDGQASKRFVEYLGLE